MSLKRLLQFISEKRQRSFYDELRDIAVGHEPIVFGPFFTEIGFETLYWIPFLRWFKEEFEIDGERILVISRGGAQAWYNGITRRYFDIFDYYSLGDFKAKNEERIGSAKSTKLSNPAKHRAISGLDKEILVAVCKDNNISDYNVLHPSHMFRVMHVIRGAPELRWVKFDFFGRNPSHEVLKSLPENYIAVKSWFGGQFRDTDENRGFVRNLIERLARVNNVVLLNTGLDVERHAGFDGWFNEASFDGKNIYSVKQHATLRDNLDMQTAVIGRAKMFVGTYGGFSYIAPFVGVPALTFYSDEEGFVYEHLDVLRRGLRALRLNTKSCVDLIPCHVKLFDRVVDSLPGGVI